MTVRYQMNLKGLSEYLEALGKDGVAIDAIAKEAVAAGGDVVLESMLNKVPVGSPPDPHIGNLKAHLERTAPEQDGNFISVEVGLRRDTDANTAIYGNVQEYGSASNQAQPYIRPSFDENKAKVRAAEKSVLEAAGMKIA